MKIELTEEQFGDLVCILDGAQWDAQELRSDCDEEVDRIFNLMKVLEAQDE